MNEGEFNTFSDKGKLGEFVASRPTLKKMTKRSSLNRWEIIEKNLRT